MTAIEDGRAAGGWWLVGDSSEVVRPGDFVTRDVDGRKIIMVRDGEILRVFYNICAHRRVQLVSEARGRARQFTCLYHGWTYSTGGRLLSPRAPARPGPAGWPESADLRSPTVDLRADGRCFAAFDEPPAPSHEPGGSPSPPATRGPSRDEGAPCAFVRLRKQCRP